VRRQSGLTLLEVLVASALLAVFFASVYGLVSGTLEIRNAIEESATPFAVGPVVMERVVEDLRGVLIEPYKDVDALHSENESVGGETCTKVDFVTTVPSRRRVKVQDEWVKARLNECGYRCTRSKIRSDAVALYRREDLGVDETPLEGGDFYKLADLVKTFRIDWYAEDPGDPQNSEDQKGEDAWDAKKEKKLPWGCKVTLVLYGTVETDDAGRPLTDAQEYTFVEYVLFPTLHDDKPGQAGGPKPP
jgi:prepilin-type N-terminal cleavage/methylation domain-containing protein